MSFVVIDVPRAERDEKPVEAYDRRAKSFVAFIRRGAVDQRASRDGLDRMTYDRASDADRRPLTDFSLECLCPETVQRYRVVFAGNKPSSPWNSDSLEDFLYHIGAIARGRVPVSIRRGRACWRLATSTRSPAISRSFS